MAQNGNNSNSNNPNSFDLGFDVDKELDELMKTLHTDGSARGTADKGAPNLPPRAKSAPSSTGQPAARPAEKSPLEKRSTSRVPRPSVPQLPIRQSQPKPKITTTTKDGIKIYEDKTDYSKMKDSNASYYTGEVYFAAKSPVRTAPEAAVRKVPYKPKNKVEAFIYGIFKTIRAGGRRGTMLYLGILLIFAVILSAFTMSFVNDILAFGRGDEVVTVTIGEDATTNQIISQLDSEGLIKHGWLCKVFMGLTKSLHEIGGEPVYLSGVYYLTPSMGLEKMLLQCQERQKADTVTVTIPEGFSIEQIASKLEKSGVCMSDEFYNNLNEATFAYKFVADIENKESRYNYLEGYLYPDTYEFFVGQNASSVINKLLENFSDKWTEEYQARADELGMTVDEVITLASIVQREAADSEQMPIIAGVFFNRLNSTGFPSLQSDATNVYINKYIKPHVSSGEYETYWAKYSTYACTGLPVGPICNPGADAISAVLWPEQIDAYYFCHDKAGNIYTAKTEAEHNANYYKTLTGED